MANFCGRCGKPLQEGEICTCQLQKGSQGQEPVQNIPGTNQGNIPYQGAPVQGNQGNVPYQGAPVQGNQGNVPYQGAPVQENQGNIPYQGAPVQENQGNIPYQGAPVQENQGNIPYQGAPVQGNPYAAGYAAASEQVVNQCKNVFANILELFRNPIAAVKRVADENKIMTPLSMVILNIAAIFLISIICMISVRLKLGDYADWISIPYVRIVLVVTILSAIYDFALAGLLLLSAKVFFREETTFAKMLAVVGSKVVLDTIFIVIGAFFMILIPVFGLLIIAVGMTFTSIIFVMGFQAVSVLSDTKKFYALFVAVIMQMVVLGFVYSITASTFVSSLGRALSYLM